VTQLQSKVQMVEIDDGSVGQRIDNFLLRILSGVPKSYVYKVIRKGQVRVNKGRIKPVYKLQLGDIVRVPPVSQQEVVAPTIHDGFLAMLRESIIFEDDKLIVINKPSGLAVHGGSGLQYGLIEGMRALMPECKELELVHRLDRATSGCILIAKKRSMLRALHELLRNNQMNKVYWTLVQGRWPKKKIMVQAPLLKNTVQSGERLVRVTPQGKPALTEFSPIQVSGRASLVKAKPVTGRTHQIRVHAQHSGHAIAGDDKYGDAGFDADLKTLGLNRLFLHAYSLEFTVLDKTYQVVAPLPDPLPAVVEALGLRLPG
jgi:23S rRNA pseudouridine955/2504/2580 synthase